MYICVHYCAVYALRYCCTCTAGSTRAYVHVHVYTGQSNNAIDKPLKIINNPRALLSANCRTVAHDKDPWLQYPEPKQKRQCNSLLGKHILAINSGRNVAGKIAFANFGTRSG